MRKGLLSLLLFVVAGLSAVHAYDFSATSPSGHTLYYEIISGTTNVGVVRPGTGSAYNNYVTGNVVIPATVVYNSTTYNVTEFRSIYDVSSGYDYGSFESCSGLTSITIPNSVTSIGNYAFYNCNGLTSVTIPNSVTSIGQNAFKYCRGLTTLNFNAINCGNFNSGSSHPFYNCPITTINIGDSVQRIPAYFAYNLDSLTSVTIGNSVTSIVYGAFSGCSGLATLNFNAINCGDFRSGSDHPFYNCRITTINIGDSVQRIPAYFAYNLESLTSVTIPNSVTSIGNYAFSDCDSLTTLNFNAINCGNFNSGSFHPFYNCPITTINIGDSVQRIPAYFAYNLESLTSVTIPNSVTSIGSSAFYDFDGLTSVTIGNSVTSIGSSAFAYCDGLTSVTISNSVTSIGNYAFSDCDSLTTLNFNAINCGDFSSSYYPFDNCPITTINIGDSVQRIPAHFAYNLESLTSVTIGNSVTSIGYEAFRGCRGLTSVTIPNSVTSIGNSAFEGCSGLTSVTIGNSVTSIGELAFYGCIGLTSVTIPNSVTSIGEWAFSLCSGLTSVTIGNSVTSIGSSAFSLCSGLTSVTIGNSVTSIGSYAFYDCSGLTSVTIPNSVTSIGSSAFSDCSGLTSVTIPNSVTSIGNYAFSSCSGLTSVTIPNSVTSIGNYVFSSCSGLTSVTIPNSVTSIGDYAFAYCIGLTSVNIPNSVTSIGEYAFYLVKNIIYNGTAIGSPWGALSVNGYIEGDFVYANNTKTSLLAYIGTSTSVTIPNSVTSIGRFAFYDCSGLTSVTIPNSVTSIGEYAFYGCSGLTSVTIPNSVTSIGEYAFYGCSGLTSLNFNAINCGDFSNYSDYRFYNCPITTINIGDSVQRIPAYFAYNLDSLTSVTIGNSVISIGKSAFMNCNNLPTITIPNSITNMEDSVFNRCFSLREVVSLAVLPPALGANIFSATAILKVPCGSANYYNSASAGWSQYFVGIEEMCDNITITVTSANESMGSVSGGGEYVFGAAATITAIPNEGYHFVSWNDGNTDNPRTITVTEDATYIATFEEGVGIESRDMLSELTFYPNPTSGIITFNRMDIMKVEVLDAVARTVAVYENAHIIDISKLTKGYYTMRITTAEGVAVRKVVRN